MTDSTRARGWLIDVPPAALAVIAEGAWIGVLYTLMQTARGEPIVLGTAWFAAFAAVGLLFARTFADRLAGNWAWTIVGLMVVAGIVGWLAASEVRAAVGRGDAAGALLLHQGGFLAALALLRGTSHALPASSERSLARLIAWGTPLLAIPLLMAQAFDEPVRSTFEAAALVQCLTFVLAATLGLALARVANLGRSAGFGWQRNRVWLAVAVLAAVVAIVALPLAVLVGPAVRLGIALVLPPLLLIAVAISLGTITLRAITIVALVGLLVFAVSRLAIDFTPNLAPTQPSPAGGGPNAQDPTATVLTWVPIIVVCVALIVFLVRRWVRRRPTAAPAGVREQRWSEPPSASSGLLGGLRWPWSGRRRRAAPTNAVDAYLAALDDLGARPDLARAVTETPAAHARRLRAGGVGTLDMELLAADYQLARFGADALSPAEDRRAIRRWRRLRERVSRRADEPSRGRGRAD